MTMQRGWIYGLFSLAVCAAPASAQQVRLRVTSDTEDTPVAKAMVLSLNDRDVWQTDDDGVLFVTVRHPGPNVFTIRHIGLAPITMTVDVPESGTRAVHVVMNPPPRLLDPVDINALGSTPQLSVFDDRRLHNSGGHFITWQDIARENPHATIDLFRNMLGLRVTVPATGAAFITSSRGTGLTGTTCRPRVGLDGVVIGQTASPGSETGAFDVNAIAPGEIYGIEIYDGGATIPGQYLTGVAGGSCGLIMIWTLNASHQRTKSPE